MCARLSAKLQSYTFACGVKSCITHHLNQTFILRFMTSHDFIIFLPITSLINWKISMSKICGFSDGQEHPPKWSFMLFILDLVALCSFKLLTFCFSLPTITHSYLIGSWIPPECNAFTTKVEEKSLMTRMFWCDLLLCEPCWRDDRTQTNCLNSETCVISLIF